MKPRTYSIYIICWLLAAGCFTPRLAAAQLRIYIVTDLEGASGVYQFAQTREPDNPLGEKAKEYLMGDIAAVVRGLRAAHATEILVLDGHGSQAFVPHLMEPGAKYITGKPRPGPLWGLDGSFALGCFSFQSSKTIACGEGGAIIGNDEELMDKCYTVHNHGTSRRGRTEVIGPKYRMNEFEAAVLLAQLAGAQERFRRRNENAAHLTSRLNGCPGIIPQKLYEGTASGSFYLYAMSYKKEHFNTVDRGRFLKAVAAEGVSLSPYLERGLHREPWVDHIVKTKAYQKTFSARRLQQFRDEMSCPKCDRVCKEMTLIWASGPLLGTRADMDDIADAILKVYENRDKLS